MAFNWQVSITIQDPVGHQSVHSFWLPNTADAVDIQEYTDLYIEELDPLIGGVIIGASVALRLTTLGAETIADKGALFPISDVEEGARFTFQSTNQFEFKHRIPTFLEGAMISGTKDVDLADADVIDYVDAIVTGLVVTSGTLQPVEWRGEDLTAVLTGVSAFTKER